MKGMMLAPIKPEGGSVRVDGVIVPTMYYDDGPPQPPKRKYLEQYEHSPAPTTQYVCKCGEYHFNVHFKEGGYETSIQCLHCKKWYIVHEG